MKWVLIRHGQTQGNLEKRYIGCRTDEPLCEAGRLALREKKYPAVSRVFVSPMRRCVETAQAVYPGVPMEMAPDLRECDFGAFENHTALELQGCATYQRWVDSGGREPFPGGESRQDFSARCVRAFERIRCQGEDCALIAHGGTLMAIMEAFALPKGAYYDFQAANGEGFVLQESGLYQPLFPRRKDDG